MTTEFFPVDLREEDDLSADGGAGAGAVACCWRLSCVETRLVGPVGTVWGGGVAWMVFKMSAIPPPEGPFISRRGAAGGGATTVAFLIAGAGFTSGIFVGTGIGAGGGTVGTLTVPLIKLINPDKGLDDAGAGGGGGGADCAN